MTDSHVVAFRRNSGLPVIRKPFGNTCGLLGYILTKELIEIAGDRSLRMLNHRQIIKDWAKSGKTKRSQSRGFWKGGRENRAEERWGKSVGNWGLRHRDYRYIPWDMEKTGDRNDPTSVRTLTSSTTHTLRWRENEPLSSDPPMLQLDTVPGWWGLQSQKHTSSDKIWILEAKFSQIETKMIVLKKKKCFSSVRLDLETAEGTWIEWSAGTDYTE